MMPATSQASVISVLKGVRCSIRLWQRGQLRDRGERQVRALVRACFYERSQGAGEPARRALQVLRESARHVKPGIPRLALPPPHGRELLKLPASRTQVAGQQAQILPRGR